MSFGNLEVTAEPGESHSRRGWRRSGGEQQADPAAGEGAKKVDESSSLSSGKKCD